MTPHVLNDEITQKMWQYAINESKVFNLTPSMHNIRLNISSERIWTRFLMFCDYKVPVKTLINHFEEEMAPNIHLAQIEFSDKIALYLALYCTIEPSFLDQLKEQGEVILHTNGLLKSFTPKPDISQKRKSVGGRQLFTPEEDKKMWNYLLLNIIHPETGDILPRANYYWSLNFWRGFVQSGLSTRNPSILTNRFSRILMHKVHETTFDTVEKAYLYIALNIPTHESFLRELRTLGHVHTDSENRIVWFGQFQTVSEDVSELEKEREKEEEEEEEKEEGDEDNEIVSSDDEDSESTEMIEKDRKTWRFVMEHMIDKETGALRKRDEFEWKKLFDDDFDDDSGFEHLSTNLMKNLHNDEEFDLKMKAAICYSLTYPLHYDLYLELFENAEIELDDCGCLVKYRWKELKTTASRKRSASEMLE